MTVRSVLMDIEGTIVPIAFVRDVLFPYAQRRMTAFLHERRHDPDVRRWTGLCQDTVAEETGSRVSDDELAVVLNRWMELDRKHQALKALQGMIWEEGYRTGAFAPQLYTDVIPALRSWRASGLQLALYSSGSEQAQRLLISHTTEGDLTCLFSGFFDTSVGGKKDPDSYRRIAVQSQLQPTEILFLSDVETELDAATTAGMKTTQITRPGTEPGNRHPIVSDFSILTPHLSIRPVPYPSQP